MGVCNAIISATNAPSQGFKSLQDLVAAVWTLSGCRPTFLSENTACCSQYCIAWWVSNLLANQADASLADVLVAWVCCTQCCWRFYCLSQVCHGFEKTLNNAPSQETISPFVVFNATQYSPAFVEYLLSCVQLCCEAAFQPGTPLLQRCHLLLAALSALWHLLPILQHRLQPMLNLQPQ